MSIVLTKKCTKCGETKSVEGFNIKSRRAKKGYSAWCKVCLNLYNKERQEKLRQLPDTERHNVTEKRCATCKEIKPASEFYRSKIATSGYRSTCTPCYLAYHRQRTASRREYRKELLAQHLASGVKQCNECGEVKPFEDFHKQSQSLDGRFSTCKECSSRIHREKYKANPRDPKVSRDRYLKTRYNDFDTKVYTKLFEQQCGVCAACGNPETIIDPRTNEIRRLATDHDHTTGKVRALLCQACNISLGLLQDDPERIHALLAYAEKWIL